MLAPNRILTVKERSQHCNVLSLKTILTCMRLNHSTQQCYGKHPKNRCSRYTMFDRAEMRCINAVPCAQNSQTVRTARPGPGLLYVVCGRESSLQVGLPRNLFGGDSSDGPSQIDRWTNGSHSGASWHCYDLPA